MTVPSDLPMEIWQRVLRCVPLQQRLESCALVCSKFHAAAVAATDSIDTHFEHVDQDSFLAYMQHHGSYLTSIKVNRLVVVEVLPCCQHLQQLCLTDCEVQLGPSEGDVGVLGSVTEITRLEIECCECFGRDAFAALSVLVNLQHLCVTEDAEHDMCELPGMVWPSVQQLTHLELNWVKLTAEDLRHISSMSRLCALELSGKAHLTSDAVPGGFALPPSLRRLTFSDVLDPSVVAAATQLTYLDLSDGIIEGQGDALSGSCLLKVLATLQHLDTLCLSWVDVNWPPASIAYQALLASSRLRSLTIDSQDLPAGVFDNLFPSESLQQLVRTCLEELTVQPQPPMDTRVLTGLVGVCPSLQRLTVCLAGGPDLNDLSKLTSVTKLALWCRDALCVQYVASLTRLRQLYLGLKPPHEPGWPSLLELTALRQLTRLSKQDYASLDTKAGPGLPPDVWQQLLERCAADSECQPAITRSLAQQLAQQQQAVTDLRQQLAEQQQEGSHMRQQLAEQQQVVTDLRQQLAQQQRQNDVLQQEVVAQGAQLPALQSQLQAVLQRL